MERYSSYKDSGVAWLGEIPEHWEVKALRNFLKPFSVRNQADKQLLSVTRERGVIIRGAKGDDDNNNVIPEDLSGYKYVQPGDFVINKMKSWQGSYGISEYEGIVSPAYFTYHLSFSNKRFFSMALRSKAYVPFFMQYSKGIRVDQWDLTPDALKSIPFFLPAEEEQEAIVNFLDRATAQLDAAIAREQQMIDLLNERKRIIIQQAVTKGLDPNAKLKPSGVEWIGEVPEGWKVAPMKRLLTFPMKYGANESAEGDDRALPRYIRITDIGENGNLKDETFRSLAWNKAKDYMLKKGDLLFARSGATVGKTYLFNEEYPACFAGYLIKAQANTKEVLPKYLYYYTLSGSYDIWKSRIFIQATIQNIGADKYSTLPVPVPSISEQSDIISYLDIRCKDFDMAIAHNQKIIALLQERKQILISEVVTGKIKVS